MLQWAVFLTIVFTLILTARRLLSPDSAGADLAASAGSAGTLSANSRNSSFLRISILVMQLLIINYSVWQMIKMCIRDRAYIALALEAEEMISRSHAIPCSNHDRPRRFKAG